MLVRLSSLVIAALAFCLAAPAQAQESPIFKQRLNAPKGPLQGVVDLHTHPMAHLGFGGKLIHGAPDVGVLMPAGSFKCNRRPQRAQTTHMALWKCKNTHGGHGLDNRCGDHIRHILVRELEKQNGANPKKRHGDPIIEWPAHNNITHQAMYVDWIKRAYQGGLRVMVALAVNNYTLAAGLRGNQPFDDVSSANTQINEMVRMVDKHAWMEIARSAADLRRIVRQDKLAIILGIEVDDIGNFAMKPKHKPRRERGNIGTPSQIRAEILRLYQAGVRYIFPVHTIDNKFAGTAVYENAFAVANKYHTGKFWDLTCADRSERITHQVEDRKELDRFAGLLGLGMDPFRNAKIPKCDFGHKNAKGLTAEGEVAIREMMKLGMLIDVDHMSQLAVNETLAVAEGFGGGYPLSSGHNNLRGIGGSENNRTRRQYQRITALGGMAGVGWGNGDVVSFRNSLLGVLGVTRSNSVALGSDINGMVSQPGPKVSGPPVRYDDSFPMYHFASKAYDYNRLGVAHYGLVPDFLKHLEQQLRGERLVTALFNGAEGFAQLWERSERAARAGASSPAPRAESVSRFRIYQNTALAGRAFKRVRIRGTDLARGIARCQSKCDRNERCQGFTFKHSGNRGMCLLKRSTARQHARGETSGVKR